MFHKGIDAKEKLIDVKGKVPDLKGGLGVAVGGLATGVELGILYTCYCLGYFTYYCYLAL